MEMNIDMGSIVYLSFDEKNVHIIDDTIKMLVPGLGAMKI